MVRPKPIPATNALTCVKLADASEARGIGAVEVEHRRDDSDWNGRLPARPIESAPISERPALGVGLRRSLVRAGLPVSPEQHGAKHNEHGNDE
jgi:hypothetical protein